MGGLATSLKNLLRENTRATTPYK